MHLMRSSQCATSAIGALLLRKVLLQLRLHGRFSELLDKRGEDAILAAEVFALTQRLYGAFYIEVDLLFHVSSLFGQV